MKTQSEIVNGVFTEQPKPTLLERLRLWFAWKFWEYSIWCGYYDNEGAPLRCTKCDSWHHSDHVITVTSSIDGYPCEKYLHCKRCGNEMGYWGYGYWDTQQGYLWRYM